MNSDDKYIAERKSYTDLINKYFENDKRILVLSGISGIGKTQIAKKFVYQERDNYEIVWWFNFKNDMYDQLKEFAKALNQSGLLVHELEIELSSYEHLISQIRDCLRLLSCRWLLVYDEVSDYHEVSKFLFESPQTGSGRILITSKNELSWKYTVKIEKMDRTQSKMLIETISDIKDNKGSDDLSELLCDYPLSLSQAALFIKYNGVSSFIDYLKIYKDGRKSLWEKEEEIYMNDSQLHDCHATVLTTIRVFMDKLKQQSKSAHRLCQYSSMLYKDGICDTLLRKLYDSCFGDEEGINVEAAYQRDLNLILSEGILQRSFLDGKITYNIHEMHQIALLDLLKEQEKKDLLNNISISIFNVFDMDWDDLVVLIHRAPSWLNQIENVFRHAEIHKIVTPKIISLKIRMLEYNMYHKRDHKEYERFIKIVRNNIDEQYRYIDKNELARFYIDCVFDRSIYEKEICNKSENDFIWALEQMKGENLQTKEYFRYLVSIANFYLFQRNFEKSFYYLKLAEEILPNIESKSYINLYRYIKGWILYEYGQFQESYNEIDLLLKNPDFENGISLRLYALVTLSECYIKLGHLDKALSTIKIAIKESQKFYQTDNSEVMALSLLAWSDICIKQNKKNDAIYKLKECIKIFEKYFGEADIHPDQAKPHILLGEIYESKGNFSLAIKEFDKVEHIYNNVYSEKNSLLFSDIYRRKFNLAVKVNDEYSYKFYFNNHKEIFGLNNDVTIEMASFINK